VLFRDSDLLAEISVPESRVVGDRGDKGGGMMHGRRGW
jgi:hypothetical protein